MQPLKLQAMMLTTELLYSGSNGNKFRKNCVWKIFRKKLLYKTDSQ